MNVVSIVAIVSILLYLCGVLFPIVMLYRNNSVYHYRMQLIDDIGEANRFSISNGDYDLWRWEIFLQVKYSTMASKFWKPLDSFYPEGFTNMNAKKEDYV